jgi:hypothetical protein
MRFRAELLCTHAGDGEEAGEGLGAMGWGPSASPQAGPPLAPGNLFLHDIEAFCGQQRQWRAFGVLRVMAPTQDRKPWVPSAPDPGPLFRPATL